MVAHVLVAVLRSLLDLILEGLPQAVHASLQNKLEVDIEIVHICVSFSVFVLFDTHVEFPSILVFELVRFLLYRVQNAISTQLGQLGCHLIVLALHLV